MKLLSFLFRRPDTDPFGIEAALADRRARRGQPQRRDERGRFAA
jgi:hypothetical protein